MGELTTIDEKNRQLEALRKELDPIGKDRAIEFCEVLLGSYPHHNIADVKIYTRSIVSVFAQYPADVCGKAVDAVTLNNKYLPTRFTVFQACEEIASIKRDLIKTTALEISVSKQMAEDKKRAADMEAERKKFRDKYGDKSVLDVMRDKGYLTDNLLNSDTKE